jgi:hypothetical protein
MVEAGFFPKCFWSTVSPPQELPPRRGLGMGALDKNQDSSPIGRRITPQQGIEGIILIFEWNKIQNGKLNYKSSDKNRKVRGLNLFLPILKKYNFQVRYER